MTEFYGDTLIEVFRKALGREPARDPRFQPLGRKDFEPTDLTGHELQVFLRPMRDGAVSR